MYTMASEVVVLVIMICCFPWKFMRTTQESILFWNPMNLQPFRDEHPKKKLEFFKHNILNKTLTGTQTWQWEIPKIYMDESPINASIDRRFPIARLISGASIQSQGFTTSAWIENLHQYWLEQWLLNPGVLMISLRMLKAYATQIGDDQSIHYILLKSS